MEHDTEYDDLYRFGNPRRMITSHRTFLEIQYEGRLQMPPSMPRIPDDQISEYTITGTHQDQTLWVALRPWRVEIKQVILYAHTPDSPLEVPSQYDETRRPNEPQYIDVDTYANPLDVVWWNDFWKELGDAPEQS
jgi:hypothetical protein